MVWNPYSNKVYEIHYPNSGVNRASAWRNLVWWASSHRERKAERYVYNMYNSYDRARFYLVSDRDWNDDGIKDIRYAKIWVPDLRKSINFFELHVGEPWNYSLPTSNCKHYAIFGLEVGGAKIGWSGPVPIEWESELLPFDISRFDSGH